MEWRGEEVEVEEGEGKKEQGEGGESRAEQRRVLVCEGE